LNTAFVFPGLIACIGIAALAAWRRRTAAAPALLAASSLLGLGFVVSAVPASAGSLAGHAASAAVLFVLVVAATGLLILAVTYTGRSTMLGVRGLAALAAASIFLQALVWLPGEGLAFANRDLPAASFDRAASPAAMAHLLYVFLLTAGALLALLGGRSRLPRSSRIFSSVLLMAAAASLLLQVIALSGAMAIHEVQAALWAQLLLAMGFAVGLFGPAVVDSVPMTRERMVDQMHDGWIALDVSGRLVDINPAAEGLLGLHRADVQGQPIRSVLPEFPDLGGNMGIVQDLEMRRRSRSQAGWRYFSIRASPLGTDRGMPSGTLMVWSDSTKQRLAEDARHRARDEMFVLLNSLSNAASHLTELDDFLSETIFQVIYPFRSQMATIYLLDDRDNEAENQGLHLASHLGIQEDQVDSLARLQPGSPTMQWLIQNRHPFTVDAISTDARVPDGLRSSDLSGLLVSPMIVPGVEGGRIIGVMCLGRTGPDRFSVDESVRAAAVAEQVATLIDSNRRSKLAIALSERRNLVRDLHDSVTQRLYALVSMTEAAQASLEAGGTVDLREILTRMGENARQAVREMRLFLFQLRPIDIEKEGLIGSLHHRLSSVEGRASVKARFLADDDIVLPKDKEVALYYIAQEALNNVMRHAYAQSVLVTLKKLKQRVVLEIRDDGKGFDSGAADSGGMGLKNMRERTMQIDGDLKIVSKPGQGTRVVISIPVGKPPRARDRRPAA